MTPSYQQTIRLQLRTSQHPFACFARLVVRAIRAPQLPVVGWFHRSLYRLHNAIKSLYAITVQGFYFTPLFKSRLTRVPKRLYLYSGMPQVIGPIDLTLGDDCRVSGVSSFFGRAHGGSSVVCRIGNNVDIGWQNSISVGTEISIGNNVRLAGRCFLAGYPGHPEDPIARAAGAPDTDDQIGAIVLKDNVWLATGVTVLAGVTIGENSIIAAGSVVTRDIPSNVIAGGCPAKVLRPILKNE